MVPIFFCFRIYGYLYRKLIFPNKTPNGIAPIKYEQINRIMANEIFDADALNINKTSNNICF
ncbi:MAG: hypothetical protein L6U99_12160 [Clostridium sp.]|nr:MAG: hypothetical protein L6U99_12160 [Clostridium sp.]